MVPTARSADSSTISMPIRASSVPSVDGRAESASRVSDMADRLTPVSDAQPAAPARLLLIDGHSMAYRAYFALPVDKFATSTGEPTNAVFGFVSMLANLLRDEAPTHVAVAFDVGRTTFRSEQYEAYKGNRNATPEPFKGQVAVIQRVLATMHIPVLEKPSFE